MRGGRPDKQGWPSGERVDYRGWDGEGTLERHPHDDGVWLAAASELDDLPPDVTTVVSLCRVGKAQVPAGLRHVEYRLLDTTAADNPNLEFVIDDAARTVQRWRDEGEVVLLHCVASQSRTPTVAAQYAVRRGVPLDSALREVCAVLPAARPKPHLTRALRSLSVMPASGQSGQSDSMQSTVMTLGCHHEDHGDARPGHGADGAPTHG